LFAGGFGAFTFDDLPADVVELMFGFPEGGAIAMRVGGGHGEAFAAVVGALGDSLDTAGEESESQSDRGASYPE
jgi:outer membrane lipoprotein SlyB